MYTVFVDDDDDEKTSKDARCRCRAKTINIWLGAIHVVVCSSSCVRAPTQVYPSEENEKSIAKTERADAAGIVRTNVYVAGSAVGDEFAPKIGTREDERNLG